MDKEALRILAGIKPFVKGQTTAKPILEVPAAPAATLSEAKPAPKAEVKTPAPKVEATPTLAPVAKTPVSEAYEASGEFEDDLDDVKQHIRMALKIMQSSHIKTHVRQTKENYGTDTGSEVAVVVHALEGAKKAVNKLYDAMVKAVEEDKKE